MHQLLRICACAVMALALVQVTYLAARMDRAPSAVALTTPAGYPELIGSLYFSVGAPGTPSNADSEVQASESPHVHEDDHVHGADPLSAALLTLDGLVVLAVIVLLARRPRPQRAAGRAVPRRSRESNVAELAEHPYIPVQERDDTSER